MSSPETQHYQPVAGRHSGPSATRLVLVTAVTEPDPWGAALTRGARSHQTSICVGEADRVEETSVALTERTSPCLTGTIPWRGRRFASRELQRRCHPRDSCCKHRGAGDRFERDSLSGYRRLDELELLRDSGADDIAFFPRFSTRLRLGRRTLCADGANSRLGMDASRAG